MKIVGVEVYSVDLPMFRAFRVAYGTITRERLLVRLRSDDGISGWGDTGHLLSGLTGESVESAMGAAKRLAAVVMGQDPSAIGPLTRRMDELLRGNVQAKCAFDVALHDLVARARGVPLSDLLGGAHVDHVESQLDIGIGPTEQVHAEIRRALELGLRSVGIRLAVGVGTVDDHVRTVRAVRDEFGPDLEISVDCNGAYDRWDAVRAIRRMEPAGIVLFEQPVAGWDLEGMAFVAAQVDTPIVADESVWNARDVHRIAELRAADVIHMKLPKAGGIRGSQAVATLCETVGLPLQMGSLIMSEIGQAALLHFIAAHPVCLRYRSKIRGGGLFLARDVTGSMLRSHEGAFLVPAGPGVGLEVDEDRLRAATLVTWSHPPGDGHGSDMRVPEGGHHGHAPAAEAVSR